jgi:hypothetical protein
MGDGSFDRMADMKLPKPVADFFEMKNAHDDEGLWTLFASDAVIIDGGEGTEIHGADEIKKWIKKAISGLKLHTEIRTFEEHNDEWVIDTVMSGDFKASPARFQYFISVQEGKISALRSEFLGSLK